MLAVALATRPEVAEFRHLWLSIPMRLPPNPGDAYVLAEEAVDACDPLLAAIRERQSKESARYESEGGEARALRDRHERELKRASAALFVSGLEILAGFYRDVAAAQRLLWLVIPLATVQLAVMALVPEIYPFAAITFAALVAFGSIVIEEATRDRVRSVEAPRRQRPLASTRSSPGELLVDPPDLRRQFGHAAQVGKRLTEPEVGTSSRPTRFSIVVLPEPEGPLMAVNSPDSKATETLSRACTSAAPEP